LRSDAWPRAEKSGPPRQDQLDDASGASRFGAVLKAVKEMALDEDGLRVLGPLFTAT
jgi:hypothetical protein